MAEDKEKEEGNEDENLNNSNNNVTYTQADLDEHLNKFKSDSEKWVQKVIWERKLHEQVIDSVWKVADDKNELINIYEENPEVAAIILEKYYEWQSIEDFKTSIDYQEDLTDPKVLDRKVEKEIKARESKRIISNAKEVFIEKLKMTDDEKSKFEETFNEIKSLKSFKIDNIENQLEKAFKLISNSDDIKRIKQAKAIAQSLATWEWKSKGTSKKVTNTQTEVNDFLKKYRGI